MNSVDYSWSGSQSMSVSQKASHMMGMPSASFDGVFSRSRASETRAMEEEALRWAALEKLSTYDRLRTGFIRRALDSYEASCQDVRSRTYYKYQAVDVANLGLAERQEFIARIFREAEEDIDTFPKKLRDRIDKVGIDLPTVEIRFENLSVEAKCHVGTRALPTLLNVTINIAESILSLFGIKFSQMTTLNILKDISGIIRSSKMTLLLGPPSSGKTTLLRALAGKPDSSLEMGGEVTYNGYKLSEFVPQKTAAYISQNDVHAGEMTVYETLDFSSKCQGVGDRNELLSELTRREKAEGILPDPEVDLFMKATSIGGGKNNLQTDYTLRILGLDICSDIVVGDEMRRGISGGQKKRLTTGEMIIGPTKTLFMDEISTGLDSSTTYQVVKCLQQIVHLGEATILMSLLQPAPETFDLFDDIILLAEGQIVYHGPRVHALEFFESCGFKCPERKGAADFLQEVTSRKDQEQYWAEMNKPYRYISAGEFVRHFKRFHVGRSLQNKLSFPFDKKKSHGAALVFTKHSVPFKELLNASISKEWLLIKRNSFVYIFKTVQLTVLALMASTVFLRTNMHSRNETDGSVYIGAIIYSVIVNMFNGFAELALALMRLPVFYKQRELLFYPTWIFSIPNCIIRIPISIVESAVWVIVTYFTTGYAPEADRFFKQWLIFFLIQQMAAGLFRVVAGVARELTSANTLACLLTLYMFSVSGFILPKEMIPKWWKWGYQISPTTYAFTALTINEMFSPRWMDKFASDGRKLGVAILENNNVSTDESWYWKSAFILLLYAVFFNVMFTLSLMYLNPRGKPNPVISEEKAVEIKANGEVEAIDYPRIRRVGLSSKKSFSRSISEDKRNKVEMMVQDSNFRNSDASPDWRDYEAYKNQAKKAISTRGMVLPFTPLVMSFNEVNYYVDTPAEMKEQGITEDRLQLLRGVTGAFRPGILTALMGVSGAGKTTLMDVLAGRKTGGYIEGDIRISGYAKNQATFARISGYCEQFDIHSPQLTIRESLIFSALLRLSNEVSKEEKLRFVDEVIDLVELDNLKDALVGLPGISGLSTEQRKRLTIAVELVANPSIIFMDEPTSGLDARAAAIVMRTIRNTVDMGRTVVCTIHQPSIDIFESFDELLLLKRGGQVIYYGPLGQNSQKLISYFEEIPGVQKIKNERNPADWMLEASSISSEARLQIDFAEIYKSSSLHMRNSALVRELSKPVPGTSDLYFSTPFPQSNFGQFKICLWKNWSIYWRNPEYNLTRVFVTIVTALLVGSIFWKIGKQREKSTDITVVIGAMYLAVIFVGFGNCSTVQPTITTERSVFYREKAAGMYSDLPYALSQVFVEVPYVFFQASYYSLMVYSMMSFEWTVTKFLWFFIISFLTFLYFTYYGMMTVAVTPNIQVAGILSSCFFFFFNLFSGLFIPRPLIPKWWVWYYWCCPVAWTLYGLIVTQYSDMYELVKVPGQADQAIRDIVMNHYGYRDDYIGIMIAVLIGFTVLFAFTYTYSIRTLNFQQR
ncbi:ABC transporter G family member 38-like [Dendrobium catenatum]|uniref:Pleiotropic drug resistance protein 15 n=1 Tax=Dendrobium catenatum TaxID=906689 RepID=A0A2I0W6Y5_9ASPA|nr:ABC transporter G family member 38-like [Dendrobium catenatum]PKU71423.1 Pleiotropic drug resistance protein 15 [Dendrobium catenatum]